MSMQHAAYRPATVSVPLSTKIVATFGTVLVLGGLLLGAWSKLMAAAPTAPQSQQVPLGTDGETLPDFNTLLHGMPVLLVVAFAFGIVVLSRCAKYVR
jgi:hypothetical protein